MFIYSPIHTGYSSANVSSLFALAGSKRPNVESTLPVDVEPNISLCSDKEGTTFAS